MMEDLGKLIRDVPDFPKEGIIFKDITPLIANPAALKRAVAQMCAPWKNDNVDYVAAVEARGFIFGACAAMELDAGFIPVRKPGKLPYKTVQATYDLEYGTDTIEVHVDAVSGGANVLLVDDLLATGGTMGACARLIEKIGGNVVGCAFLVNLAFLNGEAKLAGYKVHSLISYDGQ